MDLKEMHSPSQDMVWYAFECFACERGDSGFVFQVRSEFHVEAMACPNCAVECKVKQSWPATWTGHGAENDGGLTGMCDGELSASLEHSQKWQEALEAEQIRRAAGGAHRKEKS